MGGDASEHRLHWSACGSRSESPRSRRRRGSSFQHWSQAAVGLRGLFTWDDLNDLLARHRLDAPHLRLFNDGEQVPPYEYLHTSVTKRSEVRHRVEPSGLHRQIADGASLVLDAVDKLHPGIQDLAAALERHFRTDVQANLYAPWHPTEAFGIHWDDHGTVIFQLEGARFCPADHVTVRLAARCCRHGAG
ncbi:MULTISPECIES: JmjC domain-containing protein [unclassified Streptomyces]|uniref:JmjC domain-containing protein n=1 Tax=unclassified Streptomyces TaxID=2593676 RepID=UPI0006AF0585|nr:MULTISPECIES: cupin domain-containing protein [unclassified Streptomyces]